MVHKTPDPGLDPFVHLLHAHREIEAQVARLEHAAALAGDRASAAPALAAIADTLDYFDGPAALHQADEVETLLPRLRALAAFGQMLAAIDFQHQLNDATLAELRAAHAASTPDAPSPRLAELARRFAEMQRAHITAEERALFPHAARELSPEVLRQMGAEIAARRER